MSCPHGREESSCLICINKQTNSILAASAIQQAQFIDEQRRKTNLREVAESVRSSMRHDYLKLVKESKNKAIDFGQGEVKLDAADVELYWSEYREAQFLNIETTRAGLNNKRNALYGELGDTIRQLKTNQLGINVGIAFLALILGLVTGPIKGIGFFIGLIGMAIAAGRSIKSEGTPKSQKEWLPFTLDLVPAFATGFALGSINLVGIALCAITMVVGVKVKKMALERSTEYKSAVSAIMKVESELEQLPSQELLTEIRRLN